MKNSKLCAILLCLGAVQVTLFAPVELKVELLPEERLTLENKAKEEITNARETAMKKAEEYRKNLERLEEIKAKEAKNERLTVEDEADKRVLEEKKADLEKAEAQNYFVVAEADFLLAPEGNKSSASDLRGERARDLAEKNAGSAYTEEVRKAYETKLTAELAAARKALPEEGVLPKLDGSISAVQDLERAVIRQIQKPLDQVAALEQTLATRADTMSPREQDANFTEREELLSQASSGLESAEGSLEEAWEMIQNEPPSPKQDVVRDALYDVQDRLVEVKEKLATTVVDAFNTGYVRFRNLFKKNVLHESTARELAGIMKSQISSLTNQMRLTNVDCDVFQDQIAKTLESNLATVRRKVTTLPIDKLKTYARPLLERAKLDMERFDFDKRSLDQRLADYSQSKSDLFVNSEFMKSLNEYRKSLEPEARRAFDQDVLTSIDAVKKEFYDLEPNFNQTVEKFNKAYNDFKAYIENLQSLVRGEIPAEFKTNLR